MNTLPTICTLLFAVPNKQLSITQDEIIQLRKILRDILHVNAITYNLITVNGEKYLEFFTRTIGKTILEQTDTLISDLVACVRDDHRIALLGISKLKCYIAHYGETKDSLLLEYQWSASNDDKRMIIRREIKQAQIINYIQEQNFHTLEKKFMRECINQELTEALKSQSLFCKWSGVPETIVAEPNPEESDANDFYIQTTILTR